MIPKADAAVMRAWDPNDTAQLEELQPALEEARAQLLLDVKTIEKLRDELADARAVGSNAAPARIDNALAQATIDMADSRAAIWRVAARRRIPYILNTMNQGTDR